jgi:hypothetical protein
MLRNRSNVLHRRITRLGRVPSPLVPYEPACNLDPRIAEEVGWGHIQKPSCISRPIVFLPSIALCQPNLGQTFVLHRAPSLRLLCTSFRSIPRSVCCSVPHFINMKGSLVVVGLIGSGLSAAVERRGDTSSSSTPWGDWPESSTSPAPVTTTSSKWVCFRLDPL